MDNSNLANYNRFEVFKSVIETEFPILERKIEFDEISTILVLQIKEAMYTQLFDTQTFLSKRPS